MTEQFEFAQDLARRLRASALTAPEQYAELLTSAAEKIESLDSDLVALEGDLRDDRD